MKKYICPVIVCLIGIIYLILCGTPVVVTEITVSVVTFKKAMNVVIDTKSKVCFEFIWVGL